MSAPLPPWLNIEPMDYLKAAEAGDQAGIEKQRLAQSWAMNQQAQQQQQQEAAQRLQLAQSAQMHQQQQQQAAAALQRDKLVVETAQTAQQAQAANALRLAAMQQQGLLGAGKQDLDAKRISDQQDYQQGLLQNKSDILDLKAGMGGAKVDEFSKMAVSDLYKQMDEARTALTRNTAETDPTGQIKNQLIQRIQDIGEQIKKATAPPAPAPAAAALKTPPDNGLSATVANFQKIGMIKPDATAPAAKPPASAISYLQQHPETANQFDSLFGAGSSDQYLP